MNGLTLFSTFIVAGILLSSQVHSQRISVEGFIVNESGKQLREVTVFERLTGIGTISDQTGYFRLMLNSGDVELVFREKNYVPFTEKFTVRKDTSMVVELILENGLKDTTDKHAPAFTAISKSEREQ